MNTQDLKRLAEFSVKVRDSTLKRLRLVPVGRENFGPDEKSMTIADIARHLILCDLAYLSLLNTHFLEKNLGVDHSIIIRERKEYEDLIKRLEDLKTQRKNFILYLDQNKWITEIEVESISGKSNEDLGSLIYRMLDHEAHHRGTLAAYLSVINSK